jgi:hypothetical protein
MRSLLLSVTLVCSSSVLAAQEYAFKVMANKGPNKVKTGDNWQSVKAGSSIKPGEELKISDNSYLGLIHSTGKPLELRTPGTYKVDDLTAKVKTGSPASVVNKYVSYILASNEETKKNKLSATGAVHRGDKEITVFLPKSQLADVFSNTLLIHWELPNSKGPYIVTIKSMFDADLLRIETRESFVEVDLNAAELADEITIVVQVTAKDEGEIKSAPCLVKRMEAGQHDRISQEILELGPDIKEESALNKYLLGSFYEEKKLLADALLAYRQAAKLEPAYREAYEDFLIRHRHQWNAALGAQ